MAQQKALSLKEIEQEQRGVTALLALAEGVSGQIIWHIGGPGNVRMEMQLKEHCAGGVTRAAALLAAHSQVAP